MGYHPCKVMQGQKVLDDGAECWLPTPTGNGVFICRRPPGWLGTLRLSNGTPQVGDYKILLQDDREIPVTVNAVQVRGDRRVSFFGLEAFLGPASEGEPKVFCWVPLGPGCPCGRAATFVLCAEHDDGWTCVPACPDHKESARASVLARLTQEQLRDVEVLVYGVDDVAEEVLRLLRRTDL